MASLKKDNDFVYHEKVVERDALPDVPAASLVKPLPYDPSNKNVSGPDLFAKLVPFEAHLHASTYRCLMVCLSAAVNIFI